ncbi:NosD domain-containing protein [Halorussus sp. MSC15.2]|uniref:NosD domain-containing protein n=1 Tax=Halorussus sp. MSC15.2 TaxID=2283638 RepID=UPI0013D0DCEB|nr:right-handed parallel beta-helix repeat-containing protein [Halorussus sp. MSC15.2]NEU55416.1 right-handed parallel beta-helix repeat-containing protein [Halorussus sp. MSC15.2]
MSEGIVATLLGLIVVLGVVGPAGAVAGVSAESGPVGTVSTDWTDGTETTETTGATEITSCTTVTESGVYVLADDVTNASPTRPRTGLGACIAIRADDVTLRGGGHTVAADERGGRPGVVGVLVSARTRAGVATLVRGATRPGRQERRSNVTVTNLSTTRWGAGVAVLGTTDATLRNVSAVENLGDGVFVENSPGVELLGGTVRASNTGLFLRNAPDARVAGLNLTDNLAGVSVRNSDGVTVEGVRVAGSSQYGLGVFASANATIADSTAAGNGFADVVLSRSDDAALRNLTIARESGGTGGGDVRPRSRRVGIYLNDSDDAALTRVSVADAPGTAIYAARDSTAAGERVTLGDATLSFETRDVALDPATDAPPLPTERQVVGVPLRAVPTDDDAHLALSVGYDDAAVDRASATEDALSLWRFDAGEGWRRVESVADAERNVASAEFGDLSRNGTVLALVGEGLAEAGNATGRSNYGSVADCSAPASRYSCWTATTSVESSQSA